MHPQTLLFTQTGCLSCELIKLFLEANEVAFVERNISVDDEARREMTEQHGSHETPTLVILSEVKEVEVKEVVVGFDPVRLDALLSPASPSPDTATTPGAVAEP